ncbi:MAG: hypothetical protein ACQESR_21290 [Planctomycetota bacterium]
MNVYEFVLRLTTPELSGEQCDLLYESGCDDGTIVTRNGTTYIAFDREAESLESAIRSAVADVRSAGLDIARVEMEATV